MGDYQVTTTVFSAASSTATPTETPTATATPTPTATISATSTASSTVTPTPTAIVTVTAAPTPSSTVTATPSSAACGNGVREPGEECDDGNLVSGDGCSVTCTLEPCGLGPETGCRAPASAKGRLRIKVNARDAGKNQLQWRWGNGAATTKAEFGDPTNAEHYALCLYDAGVLVSSTRIEAGGVCGRKACWKEHARSFQFNGKGLTPDGAAQLVLRAGATGKAQVQFTGRGAHLGLPKLGAFTGPIDVQLKQASEAVCWGATFRPPFTKNDGEIFRDKSD